MNTRANEGRVGVSLILAGIGVYLPVLELIRLINHFEAQLGMLASTIYVGGCFVSAVLIAAGLTLSTRRFGITPALFLGIASFPILGVSLFYCAYLIPYFSHEQFQVSDWLLVCAICIAGILLIVWGWFNAAKR